MQELVKISELKPETLFSNETGEMDKVLKEIETYTKSLVFDAETAKGRAEITSLAYKVSKSKSALENLGKEHVSVLKNKAKIVDLERRKMREKLDNLRDEIRKPVTEYETREKKRVEAIEKRIAELEGLYTASLNYSLDELRGVLVNLQGYATDESFEEFEGSASSILNRYLKEVNERIESEEEREKEKLELERLRKEEEERKQKEREEEIRKEAAEKAKREAEERAERERKEEAERVAAEKKKLEEEKLEAEREKIAAQEREKLEKERAEAAERDRIEGERVAKEQEARRAKEAEEEKKRAVEAERKRVEREREQKEAAEAEAEKKREEDEKHRRRINNLISQALYEEAGLELEPAKKVIIAIATGKIPNVKINY